MLHKIPVVILALEDVGCGRSMEIYYQALMNSEVLEPMMVYTNRGSYQNAPAFIKRKMLCEIAGVDCYPKDSLIKKKQFRLYDSWFAELEPYIYSVRSLVGEKAIWLLDMVIPELEEMIGKYTVQVFHGHLFEIGSSYFDETRVKSFKNYWLTFTNGQFTRQKVIERCHLSPAQMDRVISPGRLLNFYLNEKDFEKKAYLKKIGLDPKKKTICYAPSWESKKIWPVGTFEEDEQLLRAFCEWTKKHHFNLILRPHHLAVQHYQVDRKMKKVAKEFSGYVHLENTEQYNYQGPKNNLLASDVLVTDLSSISIDFMSLDRPSIFFYPEEGQGIWGTLPSLTEVRRYSYAVETFQELFKLILKLTESPEKKATLLARKKVVKEFFSLSGQDSITLFREILEKNCAEMSATRFFDVTYLRRFFAFQLKKSRVPILRLQSEYLNTVAQVSK